jgi:hypothetical protein
MLNDAKIRAAKAREKAYKLTDSHRLYLLVKPGGSKLWKWSYAYDGKQKTMHFGIYPMVSLVDARAKRDEARAQLQDGRDPAVVKKLRIEAVIGPSEAEYPPGNKPAAKPATRFAVGRRRLPRRLA